jgi:signal transduction histidine kinase
MRNPRVEPDAASAPKKASEIVDAVDRYESDIALKTVRVVTIVGWVSSLVLLAPVGTQSQAPASAQRVSPRRSLTAVGFTQAPMDVERRAERPYNRYLLGGLVVLTVQLALIVGLLVQRAHRRRAEMESRHNEEAIGQLEADNSAILRAIPDLMFVLRRDGTYVDYHARDPTRLFTPPERFIGRSIREIMPPGPAETLMDALDRACKTDEPIVVEYDLPSDRPRHYEARLVAADHGRVLSIVRDVTESKRTLELNRDLAGRLIVSQEAERTRIARDLHDDACQEVASVAVAISNLLQRGDFSDGTVQRVLSPVLTRLAGIAESLRLLSHDLHPSVLQHIGLVAALESHCAEVERRYGMRVSLIAEKDVAPAAPAVALSLFRITQEALRNAARHGHAGHATVALTRADDGFALSITDDGEGFEVSGARQDGGLGLVSIEERARLVKGRVAIRSSRRQGTTIDVRVPLTVDEEALDGAGREART